MSLRLKLALPFVALALSISAFAATKPADPVRAWIGLKSPADLDNWVNWHIGEEKRLIAEMLAVQGIAVQGIDALKTWMDREFEAPAVIMQKSAGKGGK